MELAKRVSLAFVYCCCDNVSWQVCGVVGRCVVILLDSAHGLMQ